MNTYSFRKDLLAMQEELLRFAYRLAAGRKEKNDVLPEPSLGTWSIGNRYVSAANLKGWAHAIMRNLFINNYRKIVREQMFTEQSSKLYHLSLPQEA